MPGDADSLYAPVDSFLKVGQAFTGTQNVNNSPTRDRDAWRVNVRIQGLDLERGTLCGSMEALDVPKAESPVVTFWEGEIIDAVNFSFRTARWDASKSTDLRHWSKFHAFSARLRDAAFHPAPPEHPAAGGSAGGAGTGTGTGT
eukprot:CAMPEP_0184717964 /NCGR_PEP_ID=MMETSP0314-20130426/7282_1 /TAXON_ID=38298 /ORGANISM="Rhodella maculata, Strain CCMP 736" /LENGTH=143 /DNA_ID=CAMNT_0027181621 /DNA_START=505 /DNA_END=932 /DNA_ORIENTATION=-